MLKQRCKTFGVPLGNVADLVPVELQEHLACYGCGLGGSQANGEHVHFFTRLGVFRALK